MRGLIINKTWKIVIRTPFSVESPRVICLASTTLLIRLETAEWVYEEHDLD